MKKVIIALMVLASTAVFSQQIAYIEIEKIIKDPFEQILKNMPNKVVK